MKMVSSPPPIALTATNKKIATVDDFIDIIMKDHRKYIKW